MQDGSTQGPPHAAALLALITALLAAVSLSHEWVEDPPAVTHRPRPTLLSDAQLVGRDRDGALDGGEFRLRPESEPVSGSETHGDERHDTQRPGEAGAMAQSFEEKSKARPAGPDTELNAGGRESMLRDRAAPLFQASAGYWANVHVPGDPAIRLLHARLREWDRSLLLGEASRLSFEQQVVPVDQPFDAPSGHALALSLLSDSAVIAQGDKLDRITVQVGIRAIEHRRGQRPPMNLAAVIDLPPGAADASRIAARALIDALLAARQPGDRFSLLMTDPEHGLVVAPDDFRFGTVQQARKRLSGESPDGGGRALGLAQALAGAADLLSGEGADTAGERPMGSRSTLLITASPLDDIEALSHATHRRAVEGVHLSVVPLGDGPAGAAVEQLVLAGLGHRRYLESPARARQLVEDELHAASRAVARAARLSIRLAPGVGLIDIIGSEPLDADRSQRVRDIERSMDERLRRQLGIGADRGADEEGIQIVIPTIDSGDEVVILLDVAVSQAGAIADVSLRYKDLVFLRNSRLDATLALPGGEPGGEPGPAERAVLKNVLAREFSETAVRAAAALAARQPGEAAAMLRAIQSRIERARIRTPAWAADPDLARDGRVLGEYIAVLDRLAADPGIQSLQPFLADSLRLAAWAKTHQPLAD